MRKGLVENIFPSLFASALFGFIIYLIFQRINPALWYWSIVAGGALALILIVYLVLYENLVVKQYAKAEAAIGVPVVFRTTGNFQTELGKRTGNIYFCKDRIVLVGLDQKPHMTITIMKTDVESFESPRLVRLCVYTKDGNEQIIHSSEVPKLNALMRERRWGKESGKA